MQNQNTKYRTQKNVMVKAWDLVKRFGLKFRVALKYAWSLVKKYSMTVKIEFVKASGELTTRVATNLKLKDDNKNIQFWSITDNGWRKAKIANIQSIVTTFI